MTKGEATRLAVLDEATRTAAHLGLAGLTIGSLAARTELSKSGLFAHFKSKESLQLQVLERARDVFVDEVVRPALKTARGEARVRALFEHWVAVGMAGGSACLFVSASAEFDDQPGPVRDQLVRDHRDFADTMAQIFRTGIAEGQFRPDADPEQFAHDLHSLMLGFFHAYRLLDDPKAEARARHAFEALLTAARIPTPVTESTPSPNPAPAPASMSAPPHASARASGPAPTPSLASTRAPASASAPAPNPAPASTPASASAPGSTPTPASAPGSAPTPASASAPGSAPTPASTHASASISALVSMLTSAPVSSPASASAPASTRAATSAPASD